MTVRTPQQLKDLMPVSLSPAPGKVYAGHLHDVVDTFAFLASSPVVIFSAAYSASTDSDQSNSRFVSDSATDITFTIPATAYVGYQGFVAQVGDGIVTIAVAGTGAAIVSRESQYRLAGKGAAAYFFVYANDGTAPQVFLSGDTQV